MRGQVTPPRAVEMAERPVEKSRASYEEQRGNVTSNANFLQQGERNTQLDSAQTFDSFVVGTSNQLAHAAACRVTDASCRRTRHLQSAVHSFRRGPWQNPFAQCHRPAASATFIPSARCCSSPPSASCTVSSGAADSATPFPSRTSSSPIDVLLIDDFQFLQGKTMQQEFCHTFNSLVDSRRQVIVAADVPPSQLDTIDQRMRSRLMGGLVIDIELPDLELRRKIVLGRYVADEQHAIHSVMIPDDVLEFIANRVHRRRPRA